MSNNGWIGVDLDGTLATYDIWRGEDHVGDPIPTMIFRVKKWLSEGREVRIFTARVAGDRNILVRDTIEQWCLEHLGEILPITCQKDMGMIELWDDRAVTVEANTGRILSSIQFEL